MDMNKSREEDNFYMDDLLDQMEKGELKTSLFLQQPEQKQSFNQRILNTSKRFLRFYRQKSDTSIDMNMSTSSETSNESDLVSPFIEDGDQFNWELSSHDYESKLDDSNLDEFYEEYREFVLDTVPRISNRKSSSKAQAKQLTGLNSERDNSQIFKINKTKKGKYHSFNQVSNSL